MLGVVMLAGRGHGLEVGGELSSSPTSAATDQDPLVCPRSTHLGCLHFWQLHTQGFVPSYWSHGFSTPLKVLGASKQTLL